MKCMNIHIINQLISIEWYNHVWNDAVRATAE